MVRLSAPEVRKLLLKLAWAAVPPAERTLAWSEWRRRHQHRARVCHYKKRGAKPPGRTTTTVGLSRPSGQGWAGYSVRIVRTGQTLGPISCKLCAVCDP